MVKILFTGAVGNVYRPFHVVPALDVSIQGYIGSSALSAFLDHPKRDTFEITALIRSAEKADKLKQFGITTIVGSHFDESLFVKLASETDVLIACVSTKPRLLSTFSNNSSLCRLMLTTPML